MQANKIDSQYLQSYAPLLALGVDAGIRSMMPVAALTSMAASGTPAVTWQDKLTSRWASAFLRSLAFGELIVDKLPKTPPRINRGPLLARVISGGASACVLARKQGIPLAPAALVAGAGAVISSYATFHLRRHIASGSGSFVYAVMEDGAAIALGRWAIAAGTSRSQDFSANSQN